MSLVISMEQRKSNLNIMQKCEQESCPVSEEKWIGTWNMIAMLSNFLQTDHASDICGLIMFGLLSFLNPENAFMYRKDSESVVAFLLL